ncbi:MAG TPA: AbrB/MazE/SpoVT family DNA-binding domain-containing protein [bacterium]|nr:AbrB/MazE/SpoVT family DNA-binding domain-containing protein [bacterium]
MHIRLRDVGNSRGIIIPAAMLAACKMRDVVDLRIEDGHLLIAPVETARAGWFDGYQAAMDDDVLAALPLDEGDEAWVW